MKNPLSYFDKSIRRMIIVSFVLLMLIPIGFSISSLYENTWSHAEQSMVEKHALISEALVEPFTLFITSRQRSLFTLGNEILAAQSKDKTPINNLSKQWLINPIIHLMT